jgi:hypothetical protein
MNKTPIWCTVLQSALAQLKLLLRHGVLAAPNPDLKADIRDRRYGGGERPFKDTPNF